MKYKITTRGWIVFSIISIIGLFGLYNLGVFLFGTDELANELPVVIEDTLIDNDMSSNNEDIDDSSNDKDSPTTENSEEKNSEETVNDKKDSDNTASEELESSETVLDEKESSENNTDNSEEVTLEILEIDMDKSSEVLFDKNIAELDDSYVDMLNYWVDYLKRYESITITIEGHINGYPYYEDGDYGLSISLKRAKIIADYIINKGVNPSRITILNMGSKVQIDKSDDTSKHFLNRRAIIYINKKESE